MKQHKVVPYLYGLMIVLGIMALVFAGLGVVRIHQTDSYQYTGQGEFLFHQPTQTLEEVEQSFEEMKVVPVVFQTAKGEYECTVSYTQETWEQAKDTLSFTGYIYQNPQGDVLTFASLPDDATVQAAVKDAKATRTSPLFSTAMALALFDLSLFICVFFRKLFTTYETWWFLLIMAAAAVVSVLVPEEDCNGVNGLLIMALYLADTFFNILCELLIAKQNKWNFMVSVLVELTEIAICLVLAYRFATMATTLFFWLPIDIISFINWHRHPDDQQEELTKVRKLSGWMEVVILMGIVLWTVLVGGFLSGLDITTDLFGGNSTLANITCYLDAMASAVGICNGVFILFRIREQWIAWYICSLLEAVINILAGQYVLLVLKIGYLTNTTYGYIKWTQYIRNHKQQDTSLF